MANLKPGWRRVKFGEVVRLNKETCKNPAAEGIDRYIGLEHLEPGDLRIRSWGDVSDGTTFTNRVRPGQVLFGKRRAYQRKVAVADFDAVCSGDIYVFESTNPDRLLPDLLPFLCQTDSFFEYAVGTSAGSLSPRTNWTSLAEYEFALPPMEEQRRLAILFHSLVAERSALTGSLLLAHQLEKSFVRESLDAMASKHSPRPLAEGCLRITDGTHQPPKFTDSGVPFFLVKTISGGRVDWSHTNYVSEGTYLELTRRVRPRRGDVLYTAVGATYGVGLYVDFDERFVFQRHIAHIIPNRDILLGEYIALFLNSPIGKRQSDKNAIGSAQPTVTLRSLCGFTLPFPPLEQQERLVAQAMSLRQSSHALTNRLAASDAIRHAVLNGHMT